jgi:hypothetical protein
MLLGLCGLQVAEVFGRAGVGLGGKGVVEGLPFDVVVHGEWTWGVVGGGEVEGNGLGLGVAGGVVVEFRAVGVESVGLEGVEPGGDVGEDGFGVSLALNHLL